MASGIAPARWRASSSGWGVPGRPWGPTMRWACVRMWPAKASQEAKRLAPSAGAPWAGTAATAVRATTAAATTGPKRVLSNAMSGSFSPGRRRMAG